MRYKTDNIRYLDNLGPARFAKIWQVIFWCENEFNIKIMNTTTYLASKPRYEILDGLRGVAAMIVVAYHLFETYSAGPVHQILNHGYLAVDFFFVLSGFIYVGL